MDKGILSSGKVCFMFRQKSHSTHLSGLRKISSNRPPHFLRIPCRKCSPQNRRRNHKTARLEVFHIRKTTGRAFVSAAILLRTSHLNRPENRTPLHELFLRRHRCGRVTFAGARTHLCLRRIPLCKSSLFSSDSELKVSQQNSDFTLAHDAAL